MTDDPQNIEVSVHASIEEIGPKDWDRCGGAQAAPPIDPFTTYRFLHSLETSKSVGTGTGWQPIYLAARHEGVIIGVAPCYLKTHSQGEYVFDHAWADAYARAGGQYYPKIQISVPFTPVSGRRFLCSDPTDTTAQRALFDAARSLILRNQFSSLHITFCDKIEADTFTQGGAEDVALLRTGVQYHWRNRDYDSFEDFLSTLTAAKRKNIRKERKQAHGFGGSIECLTGDAILPQHWDAMWQFYQDTGARKWGQPYLTRDWFEAIHRTMRDDVLLILAKRGDHYVAGALNFIGADCLFGRYWGCLEDHKGLHFELCYYQAIEFAISNGLGRVEAGAQGDHKRARGYEPERTYSLHWFADEGFQTAVQNYLAAETREIETDITYLETSTPFKPKR